MSVHEKVHAAQTMARRANEACAEAEHENQRMRRYIAEREAEPVTLCCVCEQPVWPSLTLWQRADNRSTSYGHRRCLDQRASGERARP